MMVLLVWKFGMVVARNERFGEPLTPSIHVLEEFLNLLLEFLEDLVDIWEHKLKRVDVLVLVVLVEFFDLGVEGLSLDMLSGNGLVPLKVKATEGGSDLTEVVDESVELGHLLILGVAGIISIDELANVEEFTHDLENVIENAALHVFHENALSWVLNAPALDVVSDSLEVADFGVLVEHVDQLSSDILDLVNADGPEVLMELVVEILGLVQWSLNPSTEALIGDNFVVLLVESSDETLIGVLEEKSVELNRV